MGLLDRMRRALASHETLQQAVEPLRELEARAARAIGEVARRAASSSGELVRSVLDPEVVRDLEERARAAGASLTAREQAVAERLSEVIRARTGADVSPHDVLQVGRVVLASVIAGGVADAVAADAPGTGDPGAGDPGAVHGAPEAGAAEAPSDVETPTVLYDGMGNMDGTTTITDGGVSFDSSG